MGGGGGGRSEEHDAACHPWEGGGKDLGEPKLCSSVELNIVEMICT